MDQSAVVDPFAAVPEHQQDQPVVAAVPSPEVVTAPPETQQAPPSPATPTISAADYDALRAKLSDNETLLAQIREAAEQQRQQREAQQFETSIRDQLKESLAALAHIDSPDELAEKLYPNIQQLITKAVQARDAEWQKEWQQEAVPYQTHYRAQTLMKELALPETLYDTLVRFPDWNAMQAVAQAYRAASTQTTGQQQQDAITRQREQARASGVHAVGGVTVGAPPAQEFKDGSPTDAHVLSALQSILAR